MADHANHKLPTAERAATHDYVKESAESVSGIHATNQAIDDTWTKPLLEKPAKACIIDSSGYIACGPIIGYERPEQTDNFGAMKKRPDPSPEVFPKHDGNDVPKQLENKKL